MNYCSNHPKRRVFSQGLCAACYKIKNYKPLKRTPLKKKPFFIKSVADKRAKQLRIYGKRKRDFLQRRPICEIHGSNCGIRATEVHHSQGREGVLLLDESRWKACCSNCHSVITEHSKQAIEEGHSVSRHKK